MQGQLVFFSLGPDPFTKNRCSDAPDSFYGVQVDVSTPKTFPAVLYLRLHVLRRHDASKASSVVIPDFTTGHFC